MTKPNETCLCPICGKHPIPKRCNAFRSTCPPKPPTPGCDCALRGIHAQLIQAEDVYLGQGERVGFNTIISDTGEAVRFINPGRFILTKAGSCLVNWSVAVEGCDTKPYVRFALAVDGRVHSAASMPVTIGMVSGAALVMAGENTEIALINDTDDTVRLQAVRPMANITVVTV